MWSYAGVQFWPLLACFLYCICHRGMLHVMLLGEDSQVSLVVSVGLLLHTHHRLCTRTRGRWIDDSWWFNDQHAVKDGTNASKSILSTWIASLFVGLCLPCIPGHVDLRFSLDKGPFYAKGECVNVDSLLISTERFAYHVFRNGFEKTGERSACGSPQQITGGLCLSPKWSHNFNACARFKA